MLTLVVSSVSRQHLAQKDLVENLIDLLLLRLCFGGTVLNRCARRELPLSVVLLLCSYFVCDGVA